MRDTREGVLNEADFAMTKPTGRAFSPAPL